jgi:hypothetical protein
MLKPATYHETHNPKNYASPLVVQKEMEALSAAGQLTPDLKLTLEKTIEFLEELEAQA